MAQNDFAIPNQGGQAFRLDVQDALQSLAGHSSGATDPNTAVGTTYPYQFWADTNTSIMKMRNGADTGWIDLFQLDGEWSTIAFENGTAAAPSIYFKDSGTDTGFYSPGTDQVGIATGGSPALVVDASQRVGIGATSPGSELEVKGSTSSSITVRASTGAGNLSNILFKRDGSSGDTRIRSDVGNNTLEFITNGSQQVTINSSGNVGIGTTSPSYSLHVNGNATVQNNVFRVYNNALTAGLAVYPPGVSGTWGESTGFALVSDAGTSPIGFIQGATERARIDSSGNVGIGTTSPSSYSSQANKLVVANTSGSTGITIAGNSGSTGTIMFADGTSGSEVYRGQIDYQHGTDSMVFFTNGGNERMRIGNDGKIGVFGTNTTSFGSRSNAGAGSTYSLFAGFHSASNTANGTLSFNVTTNGNVTNTNNSYDAISDSKLKENIVDAGSQWSDIKSLQVRNYNFKEETGHQTHTQIGLIAQELELTSPGLVTTSPDLDDEGNDLGTVTKGVKYSVLYMKAVKALQEAMERIETLEAKVAALEGN